MNGALLIDKSEDISSFGVIELLQKQLIQRLGLKKKELPKLGHGGTLDPFATGLLVVLVGRAVKLARYFLGSTKTYEGRIRFGETTIPGDYTDPISEKTDILPESIEVLQDLANRLTRQPYLQTPPMHSAKKKDGKPLYELARLGQEVERKPKLCHLYHFNILNYHSAESDFRLVCGSGTYVRTLSQDFAKLLGTLAHLRSLRRTASGIFQIENAWTLQKVLESPLSWNQLPCWVPFDQLLAGFDRADATESEKLALIQGKQWVLSDIVPRVQPSPFPSAGKEDCIAIYCANSLLAIARKEVEAWHIERVFTE